MMRSIYADVHENHPFDGAIAKLCIDLSNLNVLVNRTMDRVEQLWITINKDPYCWRKLFCDSEWMKGLQAIVRQEFSENREDLQFLMELSRLLEEGIFSNEKQMGKVIDTAKIIPFGVRYSLGLTDDAILEALPSKVREAFERLRPALRMWVNSERFKILSPLALKPNESSQSYEGRIKQQAKHGEALSFYLYERTEQNEEIKKWRPTRPRSEISPEVPINHEKKKGKRVLKVLGLIAPFLILAAIPFVGPIFPLIGFILFGAVGFSYWIEPENKKIDRKQPRKSDGLSRNKSTIANDVVNDSKEKVKEKLQSGITIGNRRSTENMNTVDLTSKLAGKEPIFVSDNHKGEELAITSHFASDKPIRPPVNVNACLGGGRWLAEDRKHRERLAENDEFKMSSPISASESETSRCALFSDSNDSDIGYRSFPDIGDTSDDEKPIGSIQGSYYALGR